MQISISKRFTSQKTSKQELSYTRMKATFLKQMFCFKNFTEPRSLKKEDFIYFMSNLWQLGKFPYYYIFLYFAILQQLEYKRLWVLNIFLSLYNCRIKRVTQKTSLCMFCPMTAHVRSARLSISLLQDQSFDIALGNIANLGRGCLCPKLCFFDEKHVFCT